MVTSVELVVRRLAVNARGIRVMAREHRPRRLQVARNARECATRACVLAAAAFGDLGGGRGGSGMEATAEWLAGFN